MAVVNPKLRFPEQVTEARKCIKDRFKKCHKSLVAREDYLLARIDTVESEYKQKLRLQNETVESLRDAKSFNNDKLKSNILTETREQIIQLLDNKLNEQTADTYTDVEFIWDNLFETVIEQLGNIMLNGLSIMSPTLTFPPQVKHIVPNSKSESTFDMGEGSPLLDNRSARYSIKTHRKARVIPDEDNASFTSILNTQLYPSGCNASQNVKLKLNCSSSLPSQKNPILKTGETQKSFYILFRLRSELYPTY